MNNPALIIGQPQTNGEPVFDAPWQARAFAMAVHLNQTGLFLWKDWADRFSDRIAGFEVNDTVDGSDTYYRLWLETLEDFVEGITVSHIRDGTTRPVI